jgi:lipid A disaccharide synthetase
LKYALKRESVSSFIAFLPLSKPRDVDALSRKYVVTSLLISTSLRVIAFLFSVTAQEEKETREKMQKAHKSNDNILLGKDFINLIKTHPF